MVNGLTTDKDIMAKLRDVATHLESAVRGASRVGVRSGCGGQERGVKADSEGTVRDRRKDLAEKGTAADREE